MKEATRPKKKTARPEEKAAAPALRRRRQRNVTIDPSVNDLHLAPGEVLTEKITVRIPARPEEKFDVYFLADTTGSMTDYIGTVRDEVQAMMDTLRDLYPDMAFGVGNYKDFPIRSSPNATSSPWCFQHQVNPTLTTQTVADEMSSSKWDAKWGGGDGPEGQFYALDQLATNQSIGWRAGANRIVVWFGDVPGHDPIPADYVPSPIGEADVIASLKLSSIQVLAISTITNPDNYPEGLDGDPTVGRKTPYPFFPSGNYTENGTEEQATRIATATDGSYTKYTSGVTAGSLCDTIISMVTAAVGGFQNVHLEATGGTAPHVTEIDPPSGYGPLPGNEEHELEFTVTFTGPPCDNTDRIHEGTIDVVGRVREDDDPVTLAQKQVKLTVPACARWSYAAKFLCGYVDEAPPGVVPLTQAATLRPGIYATEVNILNHNDFDVTIHKYVYPLVREGRAVGREPSSVGRRIEDSITLEAHSATLDDCRRIRQLMGGPRPSGELSVGFFEIVSPVPLTVTAVYTANDLRGVSTSVDVEQVGGNRIRGSRVSASEEAHAGSE